MHPPQAISTWLTRMALPPEVVHRVRMFYLSMHDRQMNHHINWDFVRDLPAALRSEITNHSTAGLLDSLALFHGVDAATVRSLTAKLVPKSVAPGYDVCAEGTANDGIFILQEGSVVVVHHDTFQETVQAPAVLSETAVLAEIVQDWKLRPRGFQAVSPCTVWELSLQDMVPLLQGKPGMHARLLSMAKDSLLRSFGGFEVSVARFPRVCLYVYDFRKRYMSFSVSSCQ